MAAEAAAVAQCISAAGKCTLAEAECTSAVVLASAWQAADPLLAWPLVPYGVGPCGNRAADRKRPSRANHNTWPFPRLTQTTSLSYHSCRACSAERLDKLDHMREHEQHDHNKWHTHQP